MVTNSSSPRRPSGSGHMNVAQQLCAWITEHIELYAGILQCNVCEYINIVILFLRSATRCKAVKICKQDQATTPITTPAAIVSPARLTNTRPISLFTLAISSGIVAALCAPGAERRVISTKAVIPFCRTLQGSAIHFVLAEPSYGAGSRQYQTKEGRHTVVVPLPPAPFRKY